jgi:hypothetical protein
MKRMLKLASIGLVAILVALLPAMPAKALPGPNAFVSASGGDANLCTFSAPCATLNRALAITTTGGRVTCLDDNDYSGETTITRSVTIDCSKTTAGVGPFIVNGSGITVVIKGGIIFNTQFNTVAPCITVTLAAAVVVEGIECFAGSTGMSVTTTTPTNLTVKNSIFTQAGTGATLQPGSGGSVKATFDHVTITQGTGGGIRSDTANGPVTVDITDSVVSDNAGNGLNAVGGAGGPAVFNIHNSVIAQNGVAGVQVNGATAAAMIDTTLLDSNAAGATSVVAGGHMLTYGNNRIVGSAGSGFTGSAPLQ